MTFEDHKKSLEEQLAVAKTQGRVEGFLIVLGFIEGMQSVTNTGNLTQIKLWLEKQIGEA